MTFFTKSSTKKLGKLEKELLRARINFVERQLNGEEKLLDIGCSGSPIDSFVGLDVDVGVKSKIKSENPVIADAHALPFQDEVFDVVSMMELIEHVLNPYAVLAEARRVLKPEGKAFITTPNACYAYYFFRNFLKRPTHAEYLKYGHIVEFDAGSLKRLLQAAGLKVVKMQGSLLPLPPRTFSLNTKLGVKLARKLAGLFPYISAGLFLEVMKR